MKVLRKIQVLTEVTDKFKENFKKDVDKTLSELEKGMTNLEKEIKKVSKPSNQEENIRLNSYLHYKEQQLSSIEQLKSRKKIVEQTPIGEFIFEASLDSIVDLSVGDDLYAKTRSAKIKVKDGKITEIIE